MVDPRESARLEGRVREQFNLGVLRRYSINRVLWNDVSELGLTLSLASAKRVHCKTAAPTMSEMGQSRRKRLEPIVDPFPEYPKT
jgi:hypothetical protein